MSYWQVKVRGLDLKLNNRLEVWAIRPQNMEKESNFLASNLTRRPSSESCMSHQEIESLERKFWSASNDPKTYSELMTSNAISVIESMGFVEKKIAVEAAKQSPGWEDVEMKDKKFIDLTPDCVAMLYHASANSKDKEQPYTATIISIWVREGSFWQLGLTSHQSWDPAKTTAS